MKIPVTAPVTYAEWSVCLDMLEQGQDDEQILALMEAGTLSWTSGVANLFSERIGNAFSIRLQRCADRLTRDLRNSFEETTLVLSLLNTRQTLTFLQSVARLSSLPDMLRAHLQEELKRYAEQSQASLENSAKHDRTGKLASLIRNNNLLRYDALPPMAASINQGKATNIPSTPNTPTGIRKRNFL
ncbi:hypothetical protein QU481_14395 [Crenobacter sp. SG2303]|uniref:Uncharacterized protein n=1 Tax=Crenobacter oryzisoli TaxID=3056844 RepID=A0ABT7XQL6_9NEIS|nr:hypothetical protein [Crenobacter sp. SG2303]MDN0076076.1 hypothetical protein [Crenobacter sp. SG2303]